MAKKFGKFVLFTAAVATAAAAAYYYKQKKETFVTEPEDEDYDDFNEDLDDEPIRNYVPLKTEDKAAAPKETSDSFTPLEQVVENVSDTAEKAEETVEEFFDEDDASDEEPPINES